MSVCMCVCTQLCMYVCVYVLNIWIYWLVCMSVVMKVRSNCAIHNRIDYFNKNYYMYSLYHYHYCAVRSVF